MLSYWNIRKSVVFPEQCGRSSRWIGWTCSRKSEITWLLSTTLPSFANFLKLEISGASTGYIVAGGNYGHNNNKHKPDNDTGYTASVVNCPCISYLRFCSAISICLQHLEQSSSQISGSDGDVDSESDSNEDGESNPRRRSSSDVDSGTDTREGTSFDDGHPTTVRIPNHEIQLVFRHWLRMHLNRSILSIRKFCNVLIYLDQEIKINQDWMSQETSVLN